MRALDGDGHGALLVLVRALDVVDGQCAVIEVVRTLNSDGLMCSTRISERC